MSRLDMTEDIAETPEQLVARLDRLPAEDIRAQLTALQRVAAVRSEESVNTVWSLGKLGCKDALVLHAPSRQVQSQLEVFRLQWLVRLFWAFAKARYTGGLLATSLAREHFEHILGRSDSFVACLLSLESIATTAVVKITRLDPQGLANTAWGPGKMSLRGRPSSTAASAASIAKIAQLEPQSLANIAWSWATSHIYGQALLTLICSRALAVLEEFQPLPLTNFVWSLAGLQPSGVPPPSSVAVRVRKLVRQHNPQQAGPARELWCLVPCACYMQAANSAWASGKAGYQDEQLMEATREQALRGINGPDSQKPANLAWAWATLVLQKMASFEAAAGASSRLVPEPRPQHCANLAWAPARVMHVPERLSDATSTTFCQTVGEATPQVIARQVAKSPGELEARGPANLAWSWASLGQLDRSSLDLASSQLRLRTSECGPQETGTAAWSLGTLAMLGIPLMHAPGHRASLILEREAVQKIAHLHPQNTSNMVWRFATLLAGESGPQASANAAWALAAAGVEWSSQSIVSVVTWARRSFNCRDLVHRTAHLGDRLPSGIGLWAQARIAESGQQQPANSAWAFAATAAVEHPLTSPGERRLELRPLGSEASVFAEVQQRGKLGLRSKPAMEVLVAAGSQTIDHFDPQNLSNMAWAPAKPSMMQVWRSAVYFSFFHVCCGSLGVGLQLSEGWRCCEVRQAPSLQVVLDQAVPQMLQSEPLDTANMNAAAVAATASAAGSKMAAFDSQPLASLVDLELPGCEVLERLLAEKASALQGDNFGIIGTKWLLSCLAKKKAASGHPCSRDKPWLVTCVTKSRHHFGRGKLGVHRPGEHAEFVRRARAALLPFLLFRGARFFSLWDLMARVRSRPFVGHTAGEAICEGLDLIVMVGASKRRHGPASPNSFGAFYNESPCDRELEEHACLDAAAASSPGGQDLLSPFAMEAMSAEELRAEIEATRRQVEAERARRQELDAEITRATERQRLRLELEEMRQVLAQEQSENESAAELRRLFDEDRVLSAWHTGGRLAGGRDSGQPVMRASGGNSTSCAEMVARGEYVWRITGFSWLKSMLNQEDNDTVDSMGFKVGNEAFQFRYSPWAHCLCHQHHGSLAIVLNTKACVAIRYRIYIRAQNAEYVQWGETGDAVHDGSYDHWPHCCAYGPDVHWPGDPPASLGIFGLSYDELLHSKWVQDDTLTVKFELDVRPDEPPKAQRLSLPADVPEPTISQDTQALLEEGKCSDVQFLVQDEVIHAHSQVLCARSEVFSKQLTAGMQESLSKVIVIQDCDVATFKAFLQFLYTDRLPDAQALLLKGTSSDSGPQLGQIQALLAVSDKYQVKRLQLWCEARLSEQIDKSQVCGILCQAHLLQAKQLETACLSFIKDHMSQVLTTPSYADLIKKWPQVALKISLFSAGVSETESLAAMDLLQRADSEQPEQAAGSEP
ncbi:BTB/POZ and MATH domain-containing protein 1 [Symbiodinium microadriaticum]|uniref:BTB/POZ and MATH domain-containing protein 1 n=1 Tax=Symbiodinium microadriaticum TaxID=2951 RepID=A0A1Q9F4M4_SYMMI|nr:BTB/POZ and MATH domain-containing protein 1 [Symbiodinium microadriaticum]